MTKKKGVSKAVSISDKPSSKVPEVGNMNPEKKKSLQRRVSWRMSVESLPSLSVSGYDGHTAGDDENMRRALIGNAFEISQWPALDPLIMKRRSSLRINKRSSSGNLDIKKPPSIISSWKNCFGMKNTTHSDGIIDGPIVEIKTSHIHPIDYMSTYQGKIRANEIAIVGSEEGSIYTFEDLNVTSDAFAKLMKPMVEEELRSNWVERLENSHYQPCIGIASGISEKCTVAILAIWKLGLPYLPIKVYETPMWRISTLVEALKPILIIGCGSILNRSLEEAAKGICQVVSFENLWNSVLRERSSNKKVFVSDDQRKEKLKIEQLEEFRKQRRETNPALRIVSIFYIFNEMAEVTATFVRVGTVWNRLHAEWRCLPYGKNEVGGVYASVDSHEVLGQLLAPLLQGKPIVFMDPHDMYGFLTGIQKWKLRRLQVFPELLRAMVTMMQVAAILKNHVDGVNASKNLNFFDSVKYWLCMGSAVRRELAVFFFAHASKKSLLVNLYGNRELLSFVCLEIFKSINDLKQGNYYDIIPIGRPVLNTRVYILDPSENISESSGVGEIYVTSPYVCGSQYGGTTPPHSPPLISPASSNSIITIPNPFLLHEKDNLKARLFQSLLKTNDFGKIAQDERQTSCCSIRKNFTILYAGNAEGEVAIENYRVNTNEIVHHLRSIQGVKGSHVMVYRPGTPSKALLAFVVISKRHEITKEEIHIHLREKIPAYVLPTLIIIPGLPIKNAKINRTQLVDYYQHERRHNNRNICDHCSQGAVVDKVMGEYDPELTVLVKILYYTCGVTSDWCALHLNWTLTELRIHYTSIPVIYKQLLRHGYHIDMEEFFACHSVRDILEVMAKYCPRPAPEIAMQLIHDANAYTPEVIDTINKKEILKFFINSNCGIHNPSSLAYYSGLKNKDLELIMAGIWPLITYKKYSIAIRDKQSKHIVAALFNADCRDKSYCQQWQTVVRQHPTKYRLELVDQVDEFLITRGLINPKYPLDGMITLFFVVDMKLYNSFEKSIQVLELLFTQVIQAARSAGFRSLHVTLYDYIYTDFLVEAFNFEIVDTKQVNMFEAKDGTKPFHLAPDHISGIVLYKPL